MLAKFFTPSSSCANLNQDIGVADDFKVLLGNDIIDVDNCRRVTIQQPNGQELSAVTYFYRDTYNIIYLTDKTDLELVESGETLEGDGLLLENSIEHNIETKKFRLGRNRNHVCVPLEGIKFDQSMFEVPETARVFAELMTHYVTERENKKIQYHNSGLEKTVLSDEELFNQAYNTILSIEKASITLFNVDSFQKTKRKNLAIEAKASISTLISFIHSVDESECRDENKKELSKRYLAAALQHEAIQNLYAVNFDECGKYNPKELKNKTSYALFNIAVEEAEKIKYKTEKEREQRGESMLGKHLYRALNMATLGIANTIYYRFFFTSGGRSQCTQQAFFRAYELAKVQCFSTQEKRLVRFIGGVRNRLREVLDFTSPKTSAKESQRIQVRLERYMKKFGFEFSNSNLSKYEKAITRLYKHLESEGVGETIQMDEAMKLQNPKKDFLSEHYLNIGDTYITAYEPKAVHNAHSFNATKILSDISKLEIKLSCNQSELSVLIDAFERLDGISNNLRHLREENIRILFEALFKVNLDGTMDLTIEDLTNSDFETLSHKIIFIAKEELKAIKEREIEFYSQNTEYPIELVQTLYHLTSRSTADDREGYNREFNARAILKPIIKDLKHANPEDTIRFDEVLKDPINNSKEILELIAKLIKDNSIIEEPKIPISTPELEVTPGAAVDLNKRDSASEEIENKSLKIENEDQNL